MDCRTVSLFCLAILLVLLAGTTQSRTKKVVIHVPYKVKKIKHTHTVYKTIHHHHKHHDLLDHALPSSEDHEHFHHFHDELGAHTQPKHLVGIPDFLPDIPLENPLDLPDKLRDIPLSNRLPIPLYRRDLIK